MFNDFKDVRVLTRMALGLAVLIVCSYLSFPLWGFPAPITMQTFALCLIGLVYKPKQALAIILLYLLLGAVGLPVFAGGRGGFASFVGPSGGYLFSFPNCLYLVIYLQGQEAKLCLLRLADSHHHRSYCNGHGDLGLRAVRTYGLN